MLNIRLLLLISIFLKGNFKNSLVDYLELDQCIKGYQYFYKKSARLSYFFGCVKHSKMTN